MKNYRLCKSSHVTTTLIWTYHGIVDHVRWREILRDNQDRSLGFKKFWWVQTGFIHLIESETEEFVDEISKFSYNKIYQNLTNSYFFQNFSFAEEIFSSFDKNILWRKLRV